MLYCVLPDCFFRYGSACVHSRTILPTLGIPQIACYIVGDPFILGIALAPLWYGIPLTYSASKGVCPSKRGDRYVIMGVLIIVSCVLEIISGFMLREILIGIYGIALVICGRSKTDEIMIKQRRSTVKKLAAFVLLINPHSSVTA